MRKTLNPQRKMSCLFVCSLPTTEDEEDAEPTVEAEEDAESTTEDEEDGESTTEDEEDAESTGKVGTDDKDEED